MKVIESFLTKNPCYRKGEKIPAPKPKLMLHSVGCNQPKAAVFIRNWNSANFTAACVHAFIDAITGYIYQTLPWNYRGWHCGGGGNNSYIGIELCEPACIKYTSGSKFTCSDLSTARAAVARTYNSAVELFAMLCKKFDLNPLADGVIISHREGYMRGIASNHGDPEHLWNGLGMGYTMDGFRRAVKAAMESKSDMTEDSAAAPASADNDDMTDAEMFAYFKSQGLTDAGVAGLMGNLYAESGLVSDNLQNNGNSILGMTDAEYTAAVDNGSYTNFVRDGYGYGLAQWTYHTRKQAFLDFMKSAGVSIGNKRKQCEFLMKELADYSSVLQTLRTAKTVREASDAVLLDFERPANQSDAVKTKRAGYGQAYYDQYAAGNAFPYAVRITASALNVRQGPGAGYVINTTVKRNEVYTIVAESDGWGQLKSGAGWISLAYTVKK